MFSSPNIIPQHKGVEKQIFWRKTASNLPWKFQSLSDSPWRTSDMLSLIGWKQPLNRNFTPTNHPIFLFEGLLTLCSVHLPFENVWLRLPALPSGEKYPSPRGFFLKIFSAKEGASSEAANLTFTQTTRSGSDPWLLIGWYFYKHANKFDWFV